MAALLLATLVSSQAAADARAAELTWDATVSPGTVQASTPTDFAFQITNTSERDEKLGCLRFTIHADLAVLSRSFAANGDWNKTEPVSVSGKTLLAFAASDGSSKLRGAPYNDSGVFSFGMVAHTPGDLEIDIAAYQSRGCVEGFAGTKRLTVELTRPVSPFVFGTLASNADRATAQYASGVRVMHLELQWSSYEPTDGTFNGDYAWYVREKLTAMRAAGLKVVLGLGLQYPPSWLFAYPGSRYVDQYGNSTGVLNLTWNTTLRQKAERYLARVNADLGLNNFWAVRIGSGGSVEAMLPDEGGRNAYWGFDANAQAGSPFPGWRPGQTTWNGQAFTTGQVSQWYDWYLGSLAGGINWQIGAYKRLGFTGFLQVLMAGVGSRPAEYNQAIAGYLGGPGDTLQTMGRGAVWDRLLANITDRRNVVAYVTSMANGSGGDSLCTSADATVSPTSSAVFSWSPARWISFNADKYGLPKMGENPGRGGASNYGQAMLETAARQMQSCGFQGLMWAHEGNLYDGTSGVTLVTYANVIASY